MSIHETLSGYALVPTADDSVDWDSAWREHLGRSGLEANLSRAGRTQEQFWARFSGWMRRQEGNSHPGALLDRVLDHTYPTDSVLDIGAGAGTFTLPLAQRVRRVTAVEPSPVQSSRLEMAVREQRIANVCTVRQRWEDVELSTLGMHDVVLAVHCFQMPGIRSAVTRMIEVATRVVLLVHAVDHDLTETIRRLGIEPGPNYVYLYGCLRRLGQNPQLEYITRRFSVPLEIQLDILRWNPGLDEHQCARLGRLLEEEGRVEYVGGEPYLERWHTDAIIRVDAGLGRNSV